MHRQSLSDASYEALLRLADTYAGDVPENVTRDELEEIVSDAIEEWKVEHREQNSHSVRVEESKYDVQLEMEVERETEEETELPDSYNETRVVLMLRDPSWAFAYWDLTQADRTTFTKSEEFESVALRVYSLPESEALLGDAMSEFEIPVSLLDSRWYFNLPDQETYYCIALLVREGGNERILARSNVVWVPRGAIADDQLGDEGSQEDTILAQTGIEQLDVLSHGKRIPQRILNLIDEELLFN